MENGFRVLIAACDTFRAGAVEQLRTHTRRLNALHPPEEHHGQSMVQLFEKGYGKDAAGIAMEAIAFCNFWKKNIALDQFSIFHAVYTFSYFAKLYLFISYAAGQFLSLLQCRGVIVLS